ncbi:Conserved hypothetical protein (DUF1120) [Erwinia tasmaniensis Et1/99]|uniref:Protein GltF n=1 Tax=Erwinia tasmaniensis (strain DSM 17950 / CFBP 7177 / CIP 109463 / NCPPB 4357 / Et1/99) TaxID=465817 RepID=B2VKN5_ERWT9|nr:Conserved hypothetical protein (DUF1120) [Erwinia tasmaniensis Et1/99]
MQVIGTIKPSACTPVISNGGNIDYGIISTATLSTDSLTQLENKQLTFSITCDAPTRLALKTINGRPGTAADARGDEDGPFGGFTPMGISVENGKAVVGLGKSRDKKIGGYNIMMDRIYADDNPVNYLHKLLSSGSSSWDKMLYLPFYLKEEALISWSKPSGNTPVIFTNMTGTINVRAYINKTSELDISQPITLDGQTTIELVYL